MRVLVAYGTRGGTEALARAVANGLVAAGHAVDVMPSTQIDALDRWDAVVVGGTPYAWFWHRNAQRFIKRNVEDLFQAQPPLIIRLIDTPPRPAEDAPEPEKVVWPNAQPPPLPVAAKDPTLLVHQLVTWLCLGTGVTASAAGAALLKDSETFLAPGLILFLVVGIGNLIAALLETRRVPHSELAVTVAGSTVGGWILIQLVVFGSLTGVQLLYLLVGILTVWGGAWLWLVRNPPQRSRTVHH